MLVDVSVVFIIAFKCVLTMAAGAYLSQMMLCKEEDDASDEESPNKKRRDPSKVEKKYLYPHGLTPPLKNVRKRRFRRTLKKKVRAVVEYD